MVNLDIKHLIKILEESTIDELEVSSFWGKHKIRLRKSSLNSNPTMDVNEKSINQTDVKENRIQNTENFTENNNLIKTDNIEELVGKELPITDTNTLTIKAPLVGTFYKSPKQGAPPFISLGDNINEGQIICIIEAMKIFNEIESEYSGKIVKILVEDATPVEYDQDLLVILPD